MPGLPDYISNVFGLTTFLTVWLFFRAAGFSRAALGILLGWLLLQAAVSLTGFYTVTDTTPPRFALLAGPPLPAIIGLFALPAGRRFLDRLDLSRLTLVHGARIPVELVLFWLYLNGAAPELMTFEGRNFDILAGLSAPVIWYFGFRKGKLSRAALAVWNIVCLRCCSISYSTAYYPRRRRSSNLPSGSPTARCCIFPLFGFLAALCRLCCWRTWGLCASCFGLNKVVLSF